MRPCGFSSQHDISVFNMNIDTITPQRYIFDSPVGTPQEWLPPNVRRTVWDRPRLCAKFQPNLYSSFREDASPRDRQRHTANLISPQLPWQQYFNAIQLSGSVDSIIPPWSKYNQLSLHYKNKIEINKKMQNPSHANDKQCISESN